MAAGQPTGTINPALALGPNPAQVLGINEVLGGAAKRLEDAYRAGVVTVDDILAAGSTKPAQRATVVAGARQATAAADVAQAQAPVQIAQALGAMGRMPDVNAVLDSQARTARVAAAGEEQRAPINERIKDAQAESAAALGGVQAAIDRAIASGITPEQTAQIAQNTVQSRAQAAQNSAMAEAAKYDSLNSLLRTPDPDERILKAKLAEIGAVVPNDEKGEPWHGEKLVSFAQAVYDKHADREAEKSRVAARLQQSLQRMQSTDAKAQHLFDKFRAEPAMKSFREVKTQYGILRDAIMDPNNTSAAKDMAAIFAFMKMLDPTSVVREGEYIRARNATGLFGKVTNFAEWVASGKLLNPQQRLEFLEAARQAASSHVRAAQGVADVYSKQAAANGVEPARVTASSALTLEGDPVAEAQKLLRPDQRLVITKRDEGGRPIDWYTAQAVPGKKNPDGTQMFVKVAPKVNAGVTGARVKDGDVYLKVKDLPPGVADALSNPKTIDVNGMFPAATDNATEE